MEKSSICRTCLELSTTLIPLFSETLLLQKIQEISSIVLSRNDNLPSQVCRQCVTNIDHAFNIRQMLMKNEAKLKLTIKVEDTRWLSAEDPNNSLQKHGACLGQFEDYTKAGITVESSSSSRSLSPLDCSVSREGCDEIVENTKVDDEQQPKSIVSHCIDLRKQKNASSDQLEDYTQAEMVVESSNPSRSPSPLDCTKDCGETVENAKSNKKEPTFVGSHYTPDPASKKLLCHFCGIQFLQGSFNGHLKVHQGTPVNCKVCGKRVKNSASLGSHMYMHQSIQKVCQYCSKVFYSHSTFSEHVRRHTDSKKFKCTLCDKAFFKPNCLKKHMRSHTGERPYPCEYCKKSFSTGHVLKTHIRQHTKEKPFVCEYCSMGFPQKVSLNTHLKSKHPDKITA